MFKKIQTYAFTFGTGSFAGLWLLKRKEIVLSESVRLAYGQILSTILIIACVITGGIIIEWIKNTFTVMKKIKNVEKEDKECEDKNENQP